MVTRTVLSDLVYTLRVLTASKVAGQKKAVNNADKYTAF